MKQKLTGAVPRRPNPPAPAVMTKPIDEVKILKRVKALEKKVNELSNRIDRISLGRTPI